MGKKVISCILCVMLLLLNACDSVRAEETVYYDVQIDAGDGVQIEEVIVEDGEIYVPASSFAKYTRFEFDREERCFIVKGQEADKAFKTVRINAETKKAAVGTKLIELKNSFVIDGEAYLPFTQMLPLLNADIVEIDSDTIYLVNNGLSMAELLYDFDINDYWFNISEEFSNRTDLAFWYIAPGYLFDTVTNFEFDRLDHWLNSGACEDYQTIFTEYLKDDELFQKAMSEEDITGELLQSITGLNDATAKLNDVYDWFENLEEIDYEPLKSDKLVRMIQKSVGDSSFDDELETMLDSVHGKNLGDMISVADLLDGISFLYTYLNQVEDHQKMLDAVYGITERKKKTGVDSGDSVVFDLDDPEYLAAETIYEIYVNNITPEITQKVVLEICEKFAEKAAEEKAFGIYSATAGLAGSVLEVFLPGDSGDRALLPYHSDIANSAMRKAAVPTLDTEEATEEYRLSLLLTLTASRACYQIMAETASGYGQDDTYYKNKIEKNENMIMGLYLVANNSAFDTYENYEKFAEENERLLMESGMLNNISGKMDDIESVLKDYYRHNYEDAIGFLADVTHDGEKELIIVEVQNNLVNGYVYTANNGKVTCLLEKEGGQDHASGFFAWYISVDPETNLCYLSEESFNMWQGMGTCDIVAYHLNENGEKIIRDKIEVSGAEGSEGFGNYQNRVTHFLQNSYVIYVNHTNSKEVGRSLSESGLEMVSEPRRECSNSYPLGSLSSYDLDGDGKKEEITVVVYNGRGSIIIDGVGRELDAWLEYPTGYYTILCIDQSENRLLIGVSDYGPSDDEMTYLYAYDGTNLFSVGCFDDLLGENDRGYSDELCAICLGDGIISAVTRMDVLGTWFAKVAYAYQDNKLIDITDFYSLADFYGYETGMQVILQYDVIMYEMIEEPSSRIVIPSETAVYMTGCKRQSEDVYWVAFECDFYEETLWLFADTSEWPACVETLSGYVPSGEVFLGLGYAG